MLRGKDVAVKVQRTGLDALFKNDLQNLKFAATVFDKLDPKSDGADRDWVSAPPRPAPRRHRLERRTGSMRERRGLRPPL